MTETQQEKLTLELTSAFKKHYHRIISIYAETDGSYSITDSVDSSDKVLPENNLILLSDKNISFSIGIKNGTPLLKLQSLHHIEVENHNEISISETNEYNWNSDLILIVNSKRYWVCFRSYK